MIRESPPIRHGPGGRGTLTRIISLGNYPSHSNNWNESNCSKVPWNHKRVKGGKRHHKKKATGQQRIRCDGSGREKRREENKK